MARAFSAEHEVINAALAGLGINPVTESYASENTEQAKLATATYSMHLENILCSHPWNFALHHAVCKEAALPTGAWKWDYAFSQPTTTLRVWELENQSANTEEEWSVSDGLICTNLTQTATQTVESVTSTSVITITGHGFENADLVQTTGFTNLTNSTTYYVREKTTNNFKVEATVGGGAITLVNDASPTGLSVSNRTIDIRYIKDDVAVTSWSPQFIAALVAKLESEWAEPLVKATTLGDRKDLKFNVKLAESRSLDGQEGTPERQDTSTWLNER